MIFLFVELSLMHLRSPSWVCVSSFIHRFSLLWNILNIKHIKYQNASETMKQCFHFRSVSWLCLNPLTDTGHGLRPEPDDQLCTLQAHWGLGVAPGVGFGAVPCVCPHATVCIGADPRGPECYRELRKWGVLVHKHSCDQGWNSVLFNFS